MQKIILVAINARYTHTNPALYYLREYVKDLNYNIKIIEFDLTVTYKKIIEYIVLENPDAVGFSVYIWNTIIVKSIILELKTYLPKVKIILGGPEVSFDPENWIARLKNIDYIISGYGEAGFKYLLRYDINPTKKIIKIDSPDFNLIPFPYTENDYSTFKNRYVYYESSRGCCFKCIYCLSSVCLDRVEYKDEATVKNELGMLLKINCNCIKFIDRSFNINKNHSRMIWKYLIENYNKNLNFHFEIHPQYIDEEDLEILKKVPLDYFRFEIGVQSTNNDTLNAIQRTGDWNIIKKNIIKINNLKNIHVHLDLIAGLPYEDIKIIKKSFNDIYALKSNHFQFGFLKILKGTVLSKRIDEYEIEYEKMPPYMVLKNKWLKHEDLKYLHRIENALNSFYNTRKFKITIDELMNLFNSPFDMYETIVKYADKNGKQSFTKDWNDNARFLIDFIKNNFNEKIDFFTDCIKYDFCLLGKFNHFPDFLKDKNLIKIKRRVIDDYKKRGGVDLSEINNAAFFVPYSKDFKIKHLYKNDYAIFIDKKRIIYYKE